MFSRATGQLGLPDAARRWVSDVTGRTLRAAALLAGATSSLVFLLQFDEPDSGGTRRVLRLPHKDDWLAREPDLATREAQTLQALSASAVVAPALVAVDGSGEFCGRPAVLMTHLPGRADFSDASPSRLRALAQAIRPLHALVPPADLALFRPYLTPTQRAVPAWTPIPATWQRAIEICTQPAPAGPMRFIHRDYHPGNVLIDGTTVSGIVDWPNACLGPPQIDVAHCTLNLAVTHGPDAASRFGAEFEGEFGTDLRCQAYWDLIDCLDVFDENGGPQSGGLEALHALGAPALSVELANERLDQYVSDAVRRWEAGAE